MPTVRTVFCTCNKTQQTLVHKGRRLSGIDLLQVPGKESKEPLQIYQGLQEAQQIDNDL